MRETNHLIGVIYNKVDEPSGLRVFKYPTFKVLDLDMGRAKQMAETDGIAGITVVNGEIQESAEDLLVYGKVALNEELSFGITVIASINDEGFVVAATNGVKRNYRTADIIRLSSEMPLTNAQVVDDKIVPLKGEFRKA